MSPTDWDHPARPNTVPAAHIPGMTEIMSAAAATARETHRQSTGQFGTQSRDEAELELTAVPDENAPDTRGEQLTRVVPI